VAASRGKPTNKAAAASQGSCEASFVPHRPEQIGGAPSTSSWLPGCADAAGAAACAMAARSLKPVAV
jgi:hypothetical protein